MVATLFGLMSLSWKVFMIGQTLGNCYGTIWCPKSEFFCMGILVEENPHYEAPQEEGFPAS